MIELFEFADPLPAWWPNVAADALVTVRRVDHTGTQALWAVQAVDAGFRMLKSVGEPGAGWQSSGENEIWPTINSAFRSDPTLFLLRSNEISQYDVVNDELGGIDVRDLLESDGLDTLPTSHSWRGISPAFWEAGDRTIASRATEYCILPRWALLNGWRISCVWFDDTKPHYFVPVKFGANGEISSEYEIERASMSEQENMGRPFSYTSEIALLRLRAGFAISGSTLTSDEPAYLMRLPTDPDEERVAVAEWRRDSEENLLVEWNERNDQEELDD